MMKNTDKFDTSMGLQTRQLLIIIHFFFFRFDRMKEGLKTIIFFFFIKIRVNLSKKTFNKKHKINMNKWIHNTLVLFTIQCIIWNFEHVC